MKINISPNIIRNYINSKTLMKEDSFELQAANTMGIKIFKEKRIAGALPKTNKKNLIARLISKSKVKGHLEEKLSLGNDCSAFQPLIM